MLIVLILTVILLVLGVVEKLQIDRLIDKVQIRILVNGTRGKTSTVRLVASAMNYSGIRTMAKTTGSEASFILPDGTVVPVNRKRGRNMVREQRQLFKLALENNCEAVVCECMAIRPESQVVFSSKLFKPTLVAITNTYTDHIDQMGQNTEQVIMLSVPAGVKVIRCDDEYAGSIESFKTKFNKKSIALALRICSELGIDEKQVLYGKKEAKGDIGITEPFKFGSRTIVNGFAANDVQSAKELLKSYELKNVTVVFANRADREFRLELFGKLFRELNIDDIVVIGDNLFKCKRYLGCRSYNNNQFEALVKSCRKTVVCLGNIVGSGQEFIDYCRGEKR